ncbi:MAG TPA: DUF2188 domain-containing protein [Candidatus Izemoplasmatales bacterium]|nr:DUF2188 domain-containing protein [Candidatus Izemoplasmatales bacterium]
MLLDFFMEYWRFFAIVFGTIALMTIIYLFYNLDSLKKLARMEKQLPKEADTHERTISLKDLIDQDVIVPNAKEPSALEKKDIYPEQTIFTQKIISPEVSKPIIVEEIAEKKPKIIPEVIQNAEDKPEVPDEKGIKKPEEKKTPKKAAVHKELGRYHVYYRKEDGSWYVKREGSDRILRVLPTQREAIAFATIKAITQNSSYVVHNMDGKIRK